MDEATRRQLIARYREGPVRIEAALAGISEAELDARPAPGEWTAREIVHHLADSEAASLIRLRRLLAEDAPHIVGYDQDDYVRRFSYPGRPIAASLLVFTGVRAANAELLAQMTEADWQRTGTHSEAGAYPITYWLDVYAAHAHDHADQIRRARASAGAT